MAHARRRSSEGRTSGVEAPERCVGYGVYDPLGKKIGSVEKLFLNGSGELEYVRTRIGLLFAKRVLIPVQNAALDREARSLTLK